MDRGMSPQVGRILIEDEAGQMVFASAMREALNGKRVRRLTWENKGVYLAMESEQLMIFKTEDRMFHPLIVSAGDITATDWIVLDEDRMIH